LCWVYVLSLDSEINDLDVTYRYRVARNKICYPGWSIVVWSWHGSSGSSTLWCISGEEDEAFLGIGAGEY